MLAMEAFFGLFGLPELIVVDTEGVILGILKQLLHSLGITVKQVSRNNHKAI